MTRIWIYMIAAVLVISQSLYACFDYRPNGTITCSTSGAINVGESVIFTASNLDCSIVEYEWRLPSEAYCISGVNNYQVKCKFSPAGQYTVELLIKCIHDMWNVEPLDTNPETIGRITYTITVAPISGPWYVSPIGNDNNNGLSNSATGAFRMIQTAIDSASSGDEIRVCEGTYYEQIDLRGKNLNIHSYNLNNINSKGLAQNTIIDANKQGTPITFGGTESAACNLEGFTVQGGFPTGDDLALDLRFDDSLNIGIDSSDKGRNGKLVGPQSTFEGRIKSGVSFDGNDYIRIENYKGVLGRCSRTVSMWIKPEGTGSPTLCSWGSIEDGKRWMVTLTSNGGLTLGVWGGRKYSNINLRDGNWHHVAVTLDGDSNPNITEAKLYVDGIEDTNTVVDNCIGGREIFTEDGSDVIIGARFESGSSNPAYCYIGKMDEICIYSRALNLGEIQQLVDTAGLVGHWAMDAISGNTVSDSSSYARTGTFSVTNPTSICSVGRVDKAIQLQNNEYIQITGWTGITGGNSRTCSGWIRTGQGNGQIFSWGKVDTGEKWIVRVNSTGELRAEVQNGYIVGTTLLTDNKWHYIAVVLDNDGTPDISEVELYVDGVRESISTVLSCPINTSNSNNVQLGAYTPAPLYFNGWMDDMRIYDHPLSLEDIRRIAARRNPIVHWKLDESTGPSVDCSHYTISGTWQGNPIPTATGYIDGAVEFDGNDYISTTYAGILGSQDRTVSAWIKAVPQTVTTSETVLRSIVSWGGNTTGGAWNLAVNYVANEGPHGTIRLAANASKVVGTTRIDDNRWHHVAAVFSNDGTPTVSDIQLYIDGKKEVISYKVEAPLNTGTGINVAIGAVDYPVVPPSGPKFYFNGKIDDVRIYDQALSDTDLWQMYKETAGGGIKGHETMSQISHCIITDNESSSRGGGLIGNHGDIINCLISNNIAIDGGALSFCGGDILNCTIADNNATNYGGGLVSCSGNIINTIIWNNSDSLGQVQQSQIRDCTSIVSYSCIEGDTVYSGTDNINTDPGLLADYHINYDSPCLHSGNVSIAEWETDLDGKPRLFETFPVPPSPFVDRGAYQSWTCEYPYNTSFESYQGYSAGNLKDWEKEGYVDTSINTKEIGDSYSYQYLSVMCGSTTEQRSLYREFEENSSKIVKVRCIPIADAYVDIRHADDVIASVQFGSDGYIRVQNGTVNQYSNTGFNFTALSTLLMQRLNSSNIEDYEGAWSELRFEFNWSQNKYQVFWKYTDGNGIVQDINITSNTNFTTDDSALLTGGYHTFTKICLRNGFGSFLINSVQITNSNTWNPVFGGSQDICITYPVPASGDRLEGRYPIWGSVWYDQLGEYQIKCCPVELDPKDPQSWLLVDRGTQIKKNAVLGYWDTCRYYSGDYYLKIEVYDDLHRLINEIIEDGNETVLEGLITKYLILNGINKITKVQYPIIGKSKGQAYHYEEQPDIRINWSGSFPFEFKRIYDDGLVNRTMPLYYGWTHNHNIYIIENTTYEWVKDSQSHAAADSEGLGIGKLWLVLAAGGKLFSGEINPNNFNEVIYHPSDNEKDFIIRTSVWNGTCFDVTYVHHAPDGMTMKFQHAVVTPEGSLPSGEGLVDWMVYKGIDQMADRFGNSLYYEWDETKSYLKKIFTKDSNSNEAIRLIFSTFKDEYGTDYAPLLHKLKIQYGDQPATDVMWYSLELPWGSSEDLPSYSYTKVTGSGNDQPYDAGYFRNIRTPDSYNAFVWNYDKEGYVESCRGPRLENGGSGSVYIMYYIERDYKHALKVFTDRRDSWNMSLSGFIDYITRYGSDVDLTSGISINTVTESIIPDASDIHNEILVKETKTKTSPLGVVLNQSIITYEAGYLNTSTHEMNYFDPYFYNDISSTLFGGYMSLAGVYGYYAGGGSTTDYEYIYGETNFPTKPTKIIEYVDEEGDGLYTNDDIRKTIEIDYDDDRGNLIEKRTYINSTEFVLEQYQYHSTYDFPISQTIWSEPCFENSTGGIEYRGKRIETTYLYGDQNGNLQNNGASGDYLVQKNQLLNVDGQTEYWAQNHYYYRANGQVRASVNPVNSITYYDYDSYGYPRKVWEGAVLTGNLGDGSESINGYPQKRFYYDCLGFKILESDYLGKVQMYVNDTLGRPKEVRTYYDDDDDNDDHVMELYNAGDNGGINEFIPSRYDSDLTDNNDGDKFKFKEKYEEYNYYDQWRKKILSSGGEIDQEKDVLLRTINITGDTTGFAYRNDGSLLERCSQYGGGPLVYEQYVHDSLNRPVHTYKYNYDVFYTGQQLLPDPYILHTEYGYTASGQKSYEKVFKVNRNGSYWQAGIFDDPELQKYVEYEYDTLDRMTKQTIHIDVEDLQVTCYGYDAIGNQIYIMDPSNNVIFTAYDNANQKTIEYYAVPNNEVIYFANGSLDVIQTMAIAKVRKFTQYYPDGKVKSVAQYDTDGATILACSEYEYDSRGRINKVKQAIGDMDNDQIIEDNVTGEKAFTLYTYRDDKDATTLSDTDIYHIKITKIPNSSVEEYNNTLIVVNPEGKIETITYPSGDQEKYKYYSYDLTPENILKAKFNGLIETKTVWEGTNERYLAYEYDEYAKIEKIYTYTLDSNGEIDADSIQDCFVYEYTSRTPYELGKVKKITDYRQDPDGPGLVGQTYEFQYDPWAQNLIYYKNGDGYQLNYDYNPAYNRKTLVSVNDVDDNPVYSAEYHYDLAGRLVGVDANDIASNAMLPLAEFMYNANGNRQSLTYSSLNTQTGLYGITYSYNADNMLTDIVTSGGAFYGYEASHAGDIDGLGRMKNAYEVLTYPNSTTKSRTYTFAYDMMSQLRFSHTTNVGALDWMEEAFSYKEDGNIQHHHTLTSQPNEKNSYFRFSGDIMTGAATTLNGSVDLFDLTNTQTGTDKNGNITQLPTDLNLNTEVVEYNWDNKIRKVYATLNPLAPYFHVKYDPMGNRIWRETIVNNEAVTRKYIVDISGGLPTILCEIDATSGSLKKSYYYADGQILSQRIHDSVNPTSYTPYFYVHDRLGSVRMVINAAGQSVAAYTYRPYGAFYEGESGPSGFDNPWKYTGQWYDAEIRQYYLRARQYDPTMMRFTSKDPVAGSYEESLTLHKYLYCLNNPINRVDRSGRISLGALSAITTGTALYAQGIELAAYAADTGNWKFFDLSFATMEFIPVAMSIAAIRGGTHGLDVFARALQMKTLRNRYIRGLIQDWLIGEGVEALSPTGLSFVQGLAIDSTAYYLYSALLFGVRSYNGTSADEMADYAEWKGGI